MVSEHASPLAALGGEDAGGQNVHVAGLATALARRGVHVVVHTRRDDAGAARPGPGLTGRGGTTTSAPAPPRACPKDDLPPYMAGVLRPTPQRPGRTHPTRGGAQPLLDVRPSGARRRQAACASRSCTPSTPARVAVKRRHQGRARHQPYLEQRIDIEAVVAREVQIRSLPPPTTRHASSSSMGAEARSDLRRAVRRRPGTVHSPRTRPVTRPGPPTCRRRQPAGRAQGHWSTSSKRSRRCQTSSS